MITVTMPGWRRALYRVTPWLGVWLFLLVDVLFLRPFLANAFRPSKTMLVIALLIQTAPIILYVTAAWFRRRIIAECTYDGSTLRFTTVGQPNEEVRPILDLSEMDEWRECRSRFGFQSLIGFRLRFRDRQKRYLDLSVPNTRELVARIQADRWPKSPSEPWAS